MYDPDLSAYATLQPPHQDGFSRQNLLIVNGPLDSGSHMFSKFKKVLGKERNDSRQFFRPHWDLQGKHFTSAILDRFVNEAYESKRDLEKVAGKLDSLVFSDNLTEAVQTAIECVSYSITLKAMSDQELLYQYLLGKPWVRKHTCGCMFGIAIVTYMCAHAKREGINVDFKMTAALVLHNITSFFSQDDTRAIWDSAINMFQQLINSEERNVLSFLEKINKVTYVYVIQWEAQKPTIDDFEMDKLFSSLLQELLNNLR